jgi:hypothetical protein
MLQFNGSRDARDSPMEPELTGAPDSWREPTHFWCCLEACLASLGSTVSLPIEATVH